MRRAMIAYALMSFMGLGLTFEAMADNTSTTSTIEQVKAQAGQAMTGAMQKAEEFKQQTQAKVHEMANKVDQSEKAKQITAGLLQPIYQIAKAMSFAEFHWLAFAIMLAGVVGFALQLVLGKLVVAARGGFSITEIISDAFGFVMSVIGLVLTTQAATESSTFTQSPVAVLSSAAVGLVFGILLYIWGQAQEVQAVSGRERR